jgi:hypothetical protein
MNSENRRIEGLTPILVVSFADMLRACLRFIVGASPQPNSLTALEMQDATLGGAWIVKAAQARFAIP